MVTQVPVCYRWGTAATAGVETNVDEDGSMIHCVQKGKFSESGKKWFDWRRRRMSTRRKRFFFVQSLFKFQFDIESPA